MKPYTRGIISFVGKLQRNSSAEIVLIHSVDFFYPQIMPTPKIIKETKIKVVNQNYEKHNYHHYYYEYA